MNLKKYFALTRAGVMDALQFRMSMFVMFIGNLLYLIVVYFLWKAIYDSSGTDVVNGMTFTDTLIYLVLATALFGFMEMYTVWQVGRDIQSGRIVLDLLKPINYRRYIFWGFSGNLIVNFFATFLPTFIVIEIVTKGAIHIGINMPFFVASVVMSVMINYSIDFIVSTICLYTESIWGINIMKQVVVTLLSGATIPLAFFPDKLRSVVELMPFAAIYDSPLRFLLWDGTSMEPHEPWCMLGFQLFWCIAMMIISKLFWKISIKQITVNGG